MNQIDETIKCYEISVTNSKGAQYHSGEFYEKQKTIHFGIT